MIAFFKQLWQAWKKFAHVLGRVQTTILLTVIYFLFIPFFTLFQIPKDPLKKRLLGDTYWQTFKGKPLDIDNFRKMF